MPHRSRPLNAAGPTSSSIVRVDVAPIETVGELDPIRCLTPRSSIDKLGEVVRNRDFVSSQTAVACAWLTSRPHETGIAYMQSVPVKGRIFMRRAEAKMTLKTLG